MSPTPINVIQQYIEQLEEDADNIVEKIDQLYHQAEMGYKMVRSGLPIGAAQRGDAKKIWQDPEGEAKELQDEIKEDYEAWYARSEELIAKHLPRRLEEFQSHRSQMRSYIRLNVNAKNGPEHYANNAADTFGEQRLIVKSVPRKVEAEKLDLRRKISDSFSKDELLRSRELLDEGLTRASGVVAGVALERHLQMECDEADLGYDHDDGISTLSQTLYEADEIDKTTLKSLETLAGIRNDCAHANSQEPNEHKVRRLIDDTNDYVRGRGI